MGLPFRSDIMALGSRREIKTIVPRVRVLKGLDQDTDHTAPLVVVSRDRDGKIFVASTHNGHVTDGLLDEAKVAIRE